MENKNKLPNQNTSVPPELKNKILSYTEILRKNSHLTNLIAFKMVQTPKGLQYENLWEGDNFEDFCEVLDTGRQETGLEEKIILFKLFQEVKPEGKVVKLGYRSEKCFGCDREMEILLPINPKILTQRTVPA